ncbi:DNA primase/polymerase [Mycobacterium phage Squint]|nr:DNA primase/polymerase [Mycobacterium phage Squint]
MLAFSRCADCGTGMRVLYVGQETHPGCKKTEEEVKLQEFVDAVQRGDEAAADKLEATINKPKPAKLGPSALWYASQGWPVFPLAVGDKLPAIPTAHPKGDPLRGVCKGECGKFGHGLYDATTDPAQIRKWWGEAEYNIGIPTGHAFDVIDIDGAKGYQSLLELGDDVFPPIHGKVSTVREDSGEHWYVLPTGDGNRAGVRPGIDYRGAGGYVCVPPSRVGDKQYAWIIKPSPEILRKTK